MVDPTPAITGSTDVIALWLFGAIGVLLLATLIYLVVIMRRRYIRNTVKFNIVYKDGSIKFQRIKQPKKTNRVFGKTYIFDHKCLSQRRWYREIYYLNGVKEPVNFNDIERLKGMSASELDSVIQEKITEKLLGDNSIKTSDVLLFITILGIAVLLFMMWKMGNDGVTISPEGVVLLKDAFRSVINGG